jgi:predicted nuclease of predicted toxin-antitoxin system
MMRILANENIPACVVERLRVAGHDVGWVGTDLPGATDLQVIARAIAEKRTILTFDKDFGELAFRDRRCAPYGIVLLRMAPTQPELLAQRVALALESRSDWPGHFAVIEDGRIRLAPIPL